MEGLKEISGNMKHLQNPFFMLQLLKPPLDNACAMLRMLVTLDSKPTRFSEQGVITLSEYLSGYVVDVAHVSSFFFLNLPLAF